MRTATIFALLLQGISTSTVIRAFTLPSASFPATSTRTSAGALFLGSNPLDAFNENVLKADDLDEDVPMTKAEMREAEKEMKAEMKRLKDEAAAAAKAAEEE
uniref:Uncharacterized protein n=1 Tax=Minutocellus polymorphus TaxID=265543 RepID=A0A7S0AMA6_9STRA|mmetsp:Transcript_17172/g.28602  ORF Transcript_17172/g.28602 Transcript_17172/m.28602 type:complete len:102 (+) Transcript_17172:126-431(+)